MIPPSELDGKQFKKAVKGYNVSDVDEHMEFVSEKYSELYRAYNELEKKYAAVSAELEVFKGNEEAIRRALINAQNTKIKITKDAEKRSELIMKSTRENCDRILGEFKAQLKHERVLLTTLKSQVEEFKLRIFAQYQQHIEYLEQISPDKDTGTEWNLPENEYTARVMAQVMFDVENSDRMNTAAGYSREDSEDELALGSLITDTDAFDIIKKNKPGKTGDPTVK